MMKVDRLGQKNYQPLSDQALLRQLRCAEEESRESLGAKAEGETSSSALVIWG